MKKQQKIPVKNVVAKVTGQGFYLTPEDKICHNSRTLYVDREAYIDCSNDDLVREVLNGFGPGIGNALKNPRIKPGSLRITFQILEK